MKEIKTIEKYSIAKISAIIHACVGFLVGIFIALSNIANILFQPNFKDSVIVVIIFNLGAGLLFGLFFVMVFAVCGWFFGLILAIIYNLVAKKFGGIKINLE